MRRYMWSLFLLFPGAILLMIWWVCPRRRGQQSNDHESETKRLGQHVFVEFPIPDTVVGYVIGRRGMRVRQVEEESGAIVRFKDLSSDKGKVVVISGKREKVAVAEQTIRKIVDDQLQVETNRVEMTITIPSCSVGRLIGRHGAHIKQLQEESGARISVNSGGGVTRQCVLRGEQEAVDRALSLIQESITKERPTYDTSKISPTHLLLNEQQDYFPAFVSAVSKQGEVWIQPLDTNDPEELEVLVDTMSNTYSQQSYPPCSNIEVGSLYAAPFEHDAKWYRVKVTHKEDKRVDVVYVDYGDEGTIAVNSLKPLKSEFTHLPQQAVCCCLFGLKPKGEQWSKEGLLMLEELSHSAQWIPVMVRVKDSSGVLPSIEVIDTSTNCDVNIATEMVNSDYADYSLGL